MKTLLAPHGRQPQEPDPRPGGPLLDLLLPDHVRLPVRRGSSAGSGDSKISVGFVDQDGTPASAGLRQAFASVPLLTLQDGSLEAEKAAMQHGDVSAVIVIPKGLQAALAQAKAGTTASVAIQLYTDPSQNADHPGRPGRRRPGRRTASTCARPGRLGDPDRQPADARSPRNISDGRLPRPEHPGHGPDAARRLRRHPARPAAREGDPQAHGRHAAAALEAGRQQHPAAPDGGRRRRRADHRHRASPSSTSRSSATCWRSAGVVFLGAGAFLALGFMLASFLKTEEQATGVVQVVQMPMMFLSGIFFPFDFMPDFLQTVARLLPLTYLGDALRQDMVNGTQVAPLGMDARDPGRLAGRLPGDRGALVPLGVGDRGRSGADPRRARSACAAGRDRLEVGAGRRGGPAARRGGCMGRPRRTEGADRVNTRSGR